MDKAQLRHIFESSYNPDNWKWVMKDVFKAKVIHQQPVQLFLPSNDLALNAFELGNSTTTDDRLIGFYLVNLSPKPWIEINRVGLRTLLRNVYKNDVDGALIVFVQNDKWRFSFVSEIRERNEEGDIIKTETEPKRYTYLLGLGEICRTAADRFDLLQQNPISLVDIKDAFSVEKLNKEFFKKYKEYYELFYKYLAKPENGYRQLFLDENESDTIKQEKPVRDFVKILLGRIVFLHFLQKKGWMGVPADSKKWIGGDKHFIQNLFRTYTEKDKFHSKALCSLFFETLNTKRENDLVPETLNPHSSIRIPQSENPQSTIRNPQLKIPYLNGGLFDRDISYHEPIDFPKDYFSQLFDFFEQYNFTIDENSPDEQEVGIDPEMLGHIFENLLEENREKGAFYTPKEIVKYMCQESLIEYLCTHLCQSDDETLKSKLRKNVELLIRNNEVSEEFSGLQIAKDINKLLKEVKICDPAIGSGAFPMGLLKEIFETRRLLSHIVQPGKEFNASTIKKEIIQNSIYGVDLDIGAVEIARLRFWLSLVVDETEPHPLPNLDFKIMQGNSLLESFEGINLEKIAAVDSEDDNIIVSETGQLQLGGEFDKKVRQLTLFDKVSKENLNTLLTKYFDPDEWEKEHREKVNKTAVKKEINELVEGKIHFLIKMIKTDLEKKIKAKEEVWKQAGITDFNSLNPRSSDYKQYASLKARYEQIDNSENKLIDLQHTEVKPYFLWHLWFKDIFDKGGFDIVIGNPPYIQLQKNGGELAKLYEDQDFKTFDRNGDIYCLFYEKGYQILKQNGIHTFITSSQWKRAAYGKSLKEYFLTKNLLKLIDLGPGVFNNAIVDTNILIARNFTNSTALVGITINNIGEILTNESFISITTEIDQVWSVKNYEVVNLLTKIKNKSKPLMKWEIKINRGILTGLNEAFIINQEKKQELVNLDVNNEKIIKPLLRGRHIASFYTNWGGDYIIGTFPALKIDIENYPAIENYLTGFLPKLNQTGECFFNEEGIKVKTRKKTFNKWFETQDQIGFYKEFQKAKIIWKRIGSDLRFSYSEEEIYCLDSTCIATGEKIKFLTAFLNSKLSKFQLKETAPRTGMGDLLISVQALEPLPVYYPTENEQEKFEKLVDEIISIKKQNSSADTSSLEHQIDIMVYHLYELTYEEAKIIDPELREEDFEKYKIEK